MARKARKRARPNAPRPVSSQRPSLPPAGEQGQEAECKIEVAFDPTTLTPERVKSISDRVVATIASYATGERGIYRAEFHQPHSKSSFSKSPDFNQSSFEKSSGLPPRIDPLES